MVPLMLFLVINYACNETKKITTLIMKNFLKSLKLAKNALFPLKKTEKSKCCTCKHFINSNRTVRTILPIKQIVKGIISKGLLEW